MYSGYHFEIIVVVIIVFVFVLFSIYRKAMALWY